MILNPYVILAAVVAWGASIAGAGYTGFRAGQDNVEAQQSRERKLIERVEKTTAAAIAGIEVKHVSITQPLRTEIQHRVEYRECVHSPDVLQMVNESLTGVAVDRGELPAADTSD